ncbi:MAG: RNA methyltransferase [Nitrospirota bacterium]|jgi:TrmH family RNA methyltransferase
MAMRITSLTNPKVRAARQLRERRHRDRQGLFLIEGRREVERARTAGIDFETLFVCPELLGGEKAFSGPEVLEVSPTVAEKLALRREGVVAVARRPERPLTALPRPASPVYLVVDGVEKPGNLGAILRSADGAGVDGVIVCGGTDLWNPNVVRASLGTLFTVPLAVATVEDGIPWLAGVPIIVATPDATTLYTDALLTGALVVGREDQGVSPPWRAAATHAVRIPMRGVADSLNVAQTATLLAYAACRGRGQESVSRGQGGEPSDNTSHT